MQRTLQNRLRITRLFDIYGGLLTDRQRRLLGLYLHDDLSLSEIAECDAVTRQAVYDALRRSTEELERLDEVLRLAAAADAAGRRHRLLAERVAAVESAVARLAARLGSEAVEEITAEVAGLRRAAR